jgi:hypothetical protein
MRFNRFRKSIKSLLKEKTITKEKILNIFTEAKNSKEDTLNGLNKEENGLTTRMHRAMIY